MISPILLLILLIFSISRYYSSIGTNYTKESLVITVLSLFLTLILFSFRKEKNRKLNKNAYTICTIFLLSYVIVYFFEYIGFLVGEYDTILSSKSIGNVNINSSSICSLACLQAFLIGYVSVKTTFKKSGNAYSCGRKIIEKLVLLFSISYFIVTPKAYFLGGYGEFMNQIGVSVASTLTSTFVQAAQLGTIVLQIFANKGKKLTIKNYLRLYSIPFYAGWLLFMTLVLMSGDRGPVLYSFITFASGYFIINKLRLNYIKAGIGICLLSFFMSFMGVFRNQEGNFSLDKIVRVQEYRTERYDGENPIFTNTRDLSICLVTYRAQYEMADSGICFYGLGIANRFLGIIPGLRYFIYPLLGIDADKVDTAQLATTYLGIDYGAGTTCIGDAFINLGFWGSLLFTFLFGFLVKKMDISLWSENEAPLFFYILSLYTLSVAVYIPRSHFFAPINVSVYSYVLIILLHKFAPKR